MAWYDKYTAGAVGPSTMGLDMGGQPSTAAVTVTIPYTKPDLWTWLSTKPPTTGPIVAHLAGVALDAADMHHIANNYVEEYKVAVMANMNLGSIGGGGAGGSLLQQAMQDAATANRRNVTPAEKIAMRMNWAGFSPKNVKVFTAHQPQGCNAFVFIVTDEGKGVMLEDDPALFPSDALITQLRVLGLTS